MTSEDVNKYLPYAIGAVVIIGGVYLFKTGVGNTSGIAYTAIPPPDTSANAAAATQITQQKLQIGLEGFNSLASIVNNRLTADYNLKLNDANNQAVIKQKQLENTAQLASIKSNVKIAKTQKQTQAIASIASLAVVALMFCYNDTYDAQQKFPRHSLGVY